MAFDYVYEKGVAYAIGDPGENSSFGDIVATGGKGGHAYNGYQYYGDSSINIYSEAFRRRSWYTKWKTRRGQS